jgi:hypothetical protein
MHGSPPVGRINRTFACFAFNPQKFLRPSSEEQFTT